MWCFCWGIAICLVHWEGRDSICGSRTEAPYVASASKKNWTALASYLVTSLLMVFKILLFALMYDYLLFTIQVIAVIHVPLYRPPIDLSPTIGSCLKIIENLQTFSYAKIPNIWSSRDPLLSPTTSLVQRQLPLQFYERSYTIEIQPNVDGTPDIFSPTSLVAPRLRLLDDRLVKRYFGG